MTKTINFKLSKRLNDLGLLDNIETEYGFEYDNESHNYDVNYYLPFNKNMICKTLTLEEAIEFLIKQQITFIHIIMPVTNNNYHTINSIRYLKNGKLGEIFIWGDEDGYTDVEVYGKTFLEAIEKMIEYLLDNNLLGQ